jgi:16S rRNA processing protein RimM
MAKPRWVPLGKIGRPHGIHGAVKLLPYGETLASLKAGGKLTLHPHGRDPVELTLRSLRWQGSHGLAEFTEVATRDAARRLTGEELFVTEDVLPPTEEGEYYHFQLLGLTVENASGQALGTLSEILTTPANDVYVVRSDRREILIPAIADVIVAVDLAAGRMRVELPQGLVDDL